MEQNSSMTALVSAFARAYHSTTNSVKIFDDTVAKMLLSEAEYNSISQNMAQGIAWFNKSFKGTPQEALKWIVDNQLSPSVLGRAAFTENELKNAVKKGVSQYIILASGYDTFAYRQPAYAKNLNIFEVDRAEMIDEKKLRLKTAGIKSPKNLSTVKTDFLLQNSLLPLQNNKAFCTQKLSFCSLLGLSYYLTEEVFFRLISNVLDLVPSQSLIAFDYQNETSLLSTAAERTKKQAELAKEANEKMLSGFSFVKTEEKLSSLGCSVIRHFTPDIITEQYFSEYNKVNMQCKMSALDNVNYCLAVKL